MKILINESTSEKLREIIKKVGVKQAIALCGGLNSLIKVAFNGDLKEFYKTAGYVPYKFDSTGENMYIDSLLLESLNLEDSWDKKEKKLGEFRWTSGGMNFKFTANASKPFKSQSGQEYRRVLGMSGDSGFGYSFISKKDTIGKRGRKQIFKQIVDKFNLDSYL